MSGPPPTCPRYQYRVLGNGWFRLVSLLAADSFQDNIECAIVTRPLLGGDAADSDTALSYLWGATRDTHSIYIGGKYLRIGANLASALRHLRRPDVPLWLWIDALCIDQSDIAELKHQVKLIRTIYEFASDTIVYLGDQTGGLTGFSAWNFLERNSSWAFNRFQEKDCNLPAILEGDTDFRGDFHDIYHDVLSRDWFSRVWVFQEAVVSKHLSLQCGHRRVPWDDFVKTAVFQTQKHDRYGESLGQQDTFESVRRMWETRVAFHLAKGQEDYLPSWHREVASLGDGTDTTDILDMLVRAWHLMASNPRDKIFALLAISTGFDWQRLGTIDYGKPTAWVYTTFAKDFMSATGDYRLLSYLNSARTVESLKLPSWVPNWSSSDASVKHDPLAILSTVSGSSGKLGQLSRDVLLEE